ncbi:MAG: recombinase family protein, partial [Lentisphaeria bacterium]|nr:recombinase family protein [Lentisphaeria bacterium]
MKALIYARQSSGKDDLSESVEAQIANCQTLAEKEKLDVIGIFRDLNTSGETYPIGAEEIARVD